MPSVAIVGAGISGLAAAHTLLDAGYSVTLFEAHALVGGRATTEREAGFVYDPGAQYIKEASPATMTLLTNRFRPPDLLDIQKPVWIFNGANHIQEGDAKLNAEQKLNYRSGLIALAQKMAEGLTIHLGTHISSLQQGATWTLIDREMHAYTGFDFLLITIPAPQARELIAASQLTGKLQHTIITQLQQASYNPLISVMLAYQPQPRIRPYYALVNTDKKHAISWLAWEHEKDPARVPQGTGLLIAQMAPQYSQDTMQAPDRAIIDDVARQVATLLQEALPQPFFATVRRWHYALPAQKADQQTLNAYTKPHQLAFCGDAFVGGRVHLALENGIMAGQQLVHLS